MGNKSQGTCEFTHTQQGSSHLLGPLLGQNSSLLGSLSLALSCPEPRLKASRDVDGSQHFLLHSRLGSLQFPCQLQVHGLGLTTMQDQQEAHYSVAERQAPWHVHSLDSTEGDICSLCASLKRVSTTQAAQPKWRQTF